MGEWEQAYLPPERGGHSYQAWVPEPIADLEVPTTHPQSQLAAWYVERMRSFVSSGSRVADWYFTTADAAASTTIEGIFPSVRAVVRAQVAGRGRRSAVAAATNVAAVQKALEIGERPSPLTLEDVCAIHEVLTAGLSDYKRTPGHVRTTQVRVRHFIPPTPQRVLPLLEDLLTFCARTDVNPIHQAAIAHARFEEVHPFPDGNGRTGRALVHALWGKRGLATRETTIPFSGVLAVRKNAYFGALDTFHSLAPLAVSPGAVTPIIDVFGEAVQQSLERGEQLKNDLDAVIERWRTVRLARRGSLVARLIDDLARCPAMTVETVIAQHQVSERTARQALRNLMDSGVLRRTRYKRQSIFEAKELVAAFERSFSDLIPSGEDGAEPVPHEAADVGDALELVPDTLEDMPMIGIELCNAFMPKAKARCVLRAGHSGHHRSTVPWQND